MNRLLLTALLFSFSCHAPAWGPLHQGALFRSSLSPGYAAPRLGAERADGDADGTSGAHPIRQEMAQQARALIADTTPSSSFGDADVRRIMNSAMSREIWRADVQTAQMADRARACNAYETRRLPGIGDVVLFHNQRDINANGRSDDWYTGCGIVTAVHRRQIELVTRTGNRPRQIRFQLGGPAAHVMQGRVINNFVRVPGRHDPPDAEYLANRLYAGHIDIERLASCAAVP